MQRSTAKKFVTLDGIRFDSVDESKYYLYLKQLQAEGLVKSFEMQVPIQLIPPVTCFDGSKQRGITYKADFLVHYAGGYSVYVEIKGFANPTDLLKRKLYHYWNSKQEKQIPLDWVAYSKKWGGETGFCSYDKLMKMRKENGK